MQIRHILIKGSVVSDENVLIRVRLKCEKFTNDRWTQSDDNVFD
jgi:hypothetical protein